MGETERWPAPECEPVQVGRLEHQQREKRESNKHNDSDFVLFVWKSAEGKRQQVQVTNRAAGSETRAMEIITELRDFVASGGSKRQAEKLKQRLCNRELETIPLEEKEEPPTPEEAKLIAMVEAPPDHISQDPEIVKFGHHGKECHFKYQGTYFAVTTAAAGGKTDCIRIARLCYMRFELGGTKEDVLRFRNRLYSLVHGIPFGTHEAFLKRDRSEGTSTGRVFKRQERDNSTCLVKDTIANYREEEADPSQETLVIKKVCRFDLPPDSPIRQANRSRYIFAAQTKVQGRFTRDPSYVSPLENFEFELECDLCGQSRSSQRLYLLRCYERGQPAGQRHMHPGFFYAGPRCTMRLLGARSPMEEITAHLHDLLKSGNLDKMLDDELLRSLGDFDRAYLLRAVGHLKGDKATRKPPMPESTHDAMRKKVVSGGHPARLVMSAVTTNRQANRPDKQESLASRCRLEIDTLKVECSGDMLKSLGNLQAKLEGGGSSSSSSGSKPKASEAVLSSQAGSVWPPVSKGSPSRASGFASTSEVASPRDSSLQGLLKLLGVQRRKYDLQTVASPAISSTKTLPIKVGDDSSSDDSSSGSYSSYSSESGEDVKRSQGKKKAMEIPNEFMCPISKDVMIDPVSTADGYTYERKEIESWLQRSSMSPATNLPLENKTLVRNIALRKLIADHPATRALVTSGMAAAATQQAADQQLQAQAEQQRQAERAEAAIAQEQRQSAIAEQQRQAAIVEEQQRVHQARAAEEFKNQISDRFRRELAAHPQHIDNEIRQLKASASDIERMYGMSFPELERFLSPFEDHINQMVAQKQAATNRNADAVALQVTGLVKQHLCNAIYHKQTESINGKPFYATPRSSHYQDCQYIMYWQPCAKWAITPSICDSGENIIAALLRGEERGIVQQQQDWGAIWHEYDVASRGWTTCLAAITPLFSVNPVEACAAKVDLRQQNFASPGREEIANGGRTMMCHAAISPQIGVDPVEARVAKVELQQNLASPARESPTPETSPADLEEQDLASPAPRSPPLLPETSTASRKRKNTASPGCVDRARDQERWSEQDGWQKERDWSNQRDRLASGKDRSCHREWHSRGSGWKSNSWDSGSWGQSDYKRNVWLNDSWKQHDWSNDWNSARNTSASSGSSHWPNDRNRDGSSSGSTQLPSDWKAR